MRGANGTGKTLAYLLPVLNNLYKFQSEKKEKGRTHKSISRANEDDMFQNAN